MCKTKRECFDVYRYLTYENVCVLYKYYIYIYIHVCAMYVFVCVMYITYHRHDLASRVTVTLSDEVRQLFLERKVVASNA